MRIAMVSEHASPLALGHLGGVDAGGQNVFVAELAAGLARSGHRVTVYTRRDDPGLPARVLLLPGLVVEHVDAGPPSPVSKDLLLPYMDDFADHLWQSWRASRPEVVHAHFWMSGRASLDAAEPLELPVVQTFHALGVIKRRQQGVRDTSPTERIPEERRIVRAADHVIATSSHELFELVRMGADRRLVSVVPCGVDLARFRPDGHAVPRGVLGRIVVVSRLVQRKGIGNVISALADVPGCELLVAGGPDADELVEDVEFRRFQGIADRAGVLDRTRFLGGIPQARVPGLLRSADVVACVPWYEPFGMVALEAMACGVPVVASAVGGLVDTVLDGESGLHVPARSPDEVAQALRTLLADPRMRGLMGEAGAQRARRRYGWDVVAAETGAIYSRAIANRRALIGRQA